LYLTGDVISVFSPNYCVFSVYVRFSIVLLHHWADPEEVKDDTQLRVCSFPDDQGCTFIFRYLINNSTVEVQRTKHCGSDNNILGECLFCSSSLT